MLLSKDFNPSILPIKDGSYMAFFNYRSYDKEGNMKEPVVPMFETIASSSRSAITEARARLEEWFMKRKEQGEEIPRLG